MEDYIEQLERADRMKRQRSGRPVYHKPAQSRADGSQSNYYNYY
jgi:hypothetical protein